MEDSDMVTKDEIFGSGSSTASSTSYQKGTRQWVEKNSGDETNDSTASAEQPQQTTPAEKSLSYAELFKELNPQLTEEQKKDIDKKEKQKRVISAITDGVNALSNLYFASKGAPSVFDGRNTLSERNKVRYDKMMNDRKANEEAYRQGLMKAEQLDKEWNHRAEREKVADDQWKQSFEHTKERAKVADEHWDKDYTYRENRDNQSQENWEKTYDLQKQTQQDNKQFRKDQIDAQNKRTEAARAKGVRGKETVFSDGKGNNVIIYDNVWKGSKQSIINALSEDPQFKNNHTLSRITKGYATKDEVDSFINQNWYKSDKAKAIMLTLSQLDPATMTSEIDNDSKELNWGSSNNNQDLDW